MSATSDRPDFGGEDTNGADGQSAWDALQESFLRFFVAVLKDYRRYLVFPSAAKKHAGGFRATRLVAGQEAGWAPFLTELCGTHHFDRFVTRRLYGPGEPDVTFFDQSIDAKINRSRLRVRKLGTLFLQSAQAHATLFGEKRAWPDVIDTEFRKQRQSSIRTFGSSTFVGETEEASSPPELAVFTLFFVTFTSLIGRDLIDFYAREEELQQARRGNSLYRGSLVVHENGVKEGSGIESTLSADGSIGITDTSAPDDADPNGDPNRGGPHGAGRGRPRRGRR